MDSLSQLQGALESRYHIRRKVATGGMATVYLAHDPKHDRDVAIKVLRDDLAATVGAERFLAEIRTTARLNHPHILPLHDSGEANGFLFYVMPFVEGETLRERLVREQRLPVEDAVRLTREVADALAYAHEHHVIHRDVKPENILLQSGHALVSDFGISRAVSSAGADRITMVGMAVGTPAYMSPEQAAADRDIDARSDLYSLASMTYEMLTGEPPFTGATLEAVLAKRFTQRAPRVSLKRGNVPRAVEAAIATALAREPEERFATVTHFAQALTDSTSAKVDAAASRSIAVLPFANMSGDVANDYFSDGISEEIINALAQLPELHVAARTSAFSFKGKNVDLRSIGEQLGVATVLEGSVRKAGNRLRITAQLINVADGYHLWSERYDREMTDVFAIQDEIANAIADKLRVVAQANRTGQLVKPPTANVDAYNLYLKGRALELQRGPALVHAVGCFENVVKLDPACAAAYAELAKSLLLLSMWGLKDPRETHDRAGAAVQQALANDATLSAGFAAEALYAFCVELDRDKATAAWQKAVEYDPSDGEARALRATYDHAYSRGNFDLAVAELQDVVAGDPRNVNVRSHLALVFTFAERFDDAADVARRAIELEPTSFYARWGLAFALCNSPRRGEGIEAAEEMLALFGRHAWPMMALAIAYGGEGEVDKARAIYDELRARSRTTYVQAALMAAVAGAAGDRDGAMDYIREAITVRDPLLALTALHSPLQAPLRREPEFREYLRQVGWPVGVA